MHIYIHIYPTQDLQVLSFIEGLVPVPNEGVLQMLIELFHLVNTFL